MIIGILTFRSFRKSSDEFISLNQVYKVFDKVYIVCTLEEISQSISAEILGETSRSLKHIY